MVRRPPRTTLTYPLFPYPTRLRSALSRDQILTDRRGSDRSALQARNAGVIGATRDAALSAQPAFPVQYAQFDLYIGAAQADRAGQRDAEPAVVVPALYAGQRADRERDAGAGGDRKSTRLNSSH